MNKNAEFHKNFLLVHNIFNNISHRGIIIKSILAQVLIGTAKKSKEKYNKGGTYNGKRQQKESPQSRNKDA